MNIELWKKRKKELHLTHDQLAEMSGVSRRTIAGIFANDERYASPTFNTIQAIERALGINKNNPNYLEEVAFNDPYLIPLLGSVVAGIPIEAQEDLESYITCSFRPSEEYFALRVHGDSMKNAGIQDKSIIICHKQETAENGEIIVAMLNKEQTVKRYKIHNDSIYLMPENPDFLPIPITDHDELLILGKVVEIRITL